MTDSLPRLRCLSLGAGVQSTTLALMAAAGEIGPMPDCAIFADTQWEPKAVYEHLSRLEAALPFKVHHVTAGNLRADIEARTNSTGQRYASVPWHTYGRDGKRAMGKRQCTKEYKLVPIARKQRELIDAKGKRLPAGAVEVWIGISLDEVGRMKPSREKWQSNRWPLLELRMTRGDCERWLARHGWTAPRSACLGCPYKGNAEWRKLRDGDPAEWADAVAVDRMIRTGDQARRILREQFAHPSLTPLETVDLSTDVERGQGLLGGWTNECEGMCGV